MISLSLSLSQSWPCCCNNNSQLQGTEWTHVSFLCLVGVTCDLWISSLTGGRCFRPFPYFLSLSIFSFGCGSSLMGDGLIIIFINLFLSLFYFILLFGVRITPVWVPVCVLFWRKRRSFMFAFWLMGWAWGPESQWWPLLYKQLCPIKNLYTGAGEEKRKKSCTLFHFELKLHLRHMYFSHVIGLKERRLEIKFQYSILELADVA